MANVVDFISQSSHYLQSICNPSTTLLTLFALLHEEELLFRVEDVQDVSKDFLYGALGSHPCFPSHVALGCYLWVVAAVAPAGVVAAFAEPRCWSAGAVLYVLG